MPPHDPPSFWAEIADAVDVGDVTVPLSVKVPIASRSSGTIVTASNEKVARNDTIHCTVTEPPLPIPWPRG